MNLEIVQEMMKVYLNDVESYGDEEHYLESRVVLDDFLMYWKARWDDEDEDEIAY